MDTKAKIDPAKIDKDLGYIHNLAFHEAWPKKPPLTIPAHLPDPVARNFMQAKECMAKKNFEESASMSYRRTLELALKVFDDEIGKAKLVNRIDKIFDKGLISPAMKNWAHEIRELGNEGAHDMDIPDREDIEQMGLFTEQLLTHLFTMPKELELARAKRKGAH
jgi:hypothetical protein